MKKNSFALLERLISPLNAQVGAGCGSCNTNTVVQDFPVATIGINSALKIKRGGIAGMALLKCNSPFTDVLDQAEWQAKLDGSVGPPVVAPSLRIVKNCYFGASKTGEGVTQTVGAYETIVQTGINYTIEGTVSADNTSYDLAKFFIDIQGRPTDFLIALITCDGEVSPFIKGSIRVIQNTEGTTSGLAPWVFTITYNTQQDALPYAFTGGWSIDDLTFN